jgi:hypothetical protein
MFIFKPRKKRAAGASGTGSALERVATVPIQDSQIERIVIP